MIIWLASYPKSGDTFLRSLLSTYIFSNDGNFEFELLKNIEQFPTNALFEHMGVDTQNENEMFKNYINSQKIYNDGKSIRFLETKSCFVNTKDFKFTDRHNTLGVIYLVRDPRNVLFSHSKNFQQTLQKSLENILSNQYLGKTSKIHCTTYIGSWKNHYNSWKIFNNFNKFCLIRYEDLITDTEKSFLKILKFIAHLNQVKLTIDKKKFENTLTTTTFEKVQKFDSAEIFEESKETLDKEIQESLERELGNEMKELKYL